MEDMFRPRSEPARTIYDAFDLESRFRKGRSVEQWKTRELNAVASATRAYCDKHGFFPPTLDEIIEASEQASGHVDYCAKWAFGIADRLKPIFDEKELK